MRRCFVLFLLLLFAGCAAAPQQAPPPQPLAEPRSSSSLIGLTSQQLVVRFGAPALQVREGNSLKLQFRGTRCVMDAYLYPSAQSGALEVTHVDTRLPSGSDTDQAACVAALADRSN